jgi:Flp pilus assembly protein TadB
MTFVVTGAYIFILFAVGMFFARRENRKQYEQAKQEKEEHSAALSKAKALQGPERRTGGDRRQKRAVAR